MATTAPHSYVSIDQWFNRNPGLAIPCISIAYIKEMTVKRYMRSRTIKKHRSKFNRVMNQIKAINCVVLTLLKNKFKIVLRELVYAPPMKKGLTGGMRYNIAKASFENERECLLTKET